MKYKTLTFILLIVFSNGAILAQDTMRLTLDSCLLYAAKHNLQVQSAVLNQSSSEVSLTGAKLRFLPTLGASASQTLASSGTTGGGQAGLSGSLTLFNGLSNIRNLQQSRLNSQQSTLKIQQAKNNVDVQIVSAYLTILMNKEKLSYQREVLETSRQQQLEGEVKYKVGRILESDYLLLEASYTSAQSEIDNTLLTIEDNISGLSTLIGLDDSIVLEVIPLDDTLRAADRTVLPFDSLMDMARQHMPDWQISQMNVDMARLDVNLAQSNFMPTVSLNGNYGGQWLPEDATTGTESSVSSNGSLTLGVSIPILNHGTSYTQLKQSKIALQQAELQHHQTLLDLEDELEGMYVTSRQALNRYRSTEALAAAYHANYNVYVLKYGEGAVTTVEMLQQQDKYLTALNDWLQSKYNYLLIERQIDIYTGK